MTNWGIPTPPIEQLEHPEIFVVSEIDRRIKQLEAEVAAQSKLIQENIDSVKTQLKEQDSALRMLLREMQNATKIRCETLQEVELECSRQVVHKVDSWAATIKTNLDNIDDGLGDLEARIVQKVNILQDNLFVNRLKKWFGRK